MMVKKDKKKRKISLFSTLVSFNEVFLRAQDINCYAVSLPGLLGITLDTYAAISTFTVMLKFTRGRCEQVIQVPEGFPGHLF